MVWARCGVVGRADATIYGLTALSLSANRRLCHTVGCMGVAVDCFAVFAARSRAAATTNLARSILAFALEVIFVPIICPAH